MPPLLGLMGIKSPSGDTGRWLGNGEGKDKPKGAMQYHVIKPYDSEKKNWKKKVPLQGERGKKKQAYTKRRHDKCKPGANWLGKSSYRTGETTLMREEYRKYNRSIPPEKGKKERSRGINQWV